MSRQDLVKDILRLKMRIGEEVIGILPEDIQGHVVKRRRAILQAVQEACGEFLAEEGDKDQEKGNLKAVAID